VSLTNSNQFTIDFMRATKGGLAKPCPNQPHAGTRHISTADISLIVSLLSSCTHVEAEKNALLVFPASSSISNAFNHLCIRMVVLSPPKNLSYVPWHPATRARLSKNICRQSEQKQPCASRHSHKPLSSRGTHRQCPVWSVCF
jgi:hypothetical protein